MLDLCSLWRGQSFLSIFWKEKLIWKSKFRLLKIKKYGLVVTGQYSGLPLHRQGLNIPWQQNIFYVFFSFLLKQEYIEAPYAGQFFKVWSFKKRLRSSEYQLDSDHYGFTLFTRALYCLISGKRKKSAFGKADQHGGTKTAMPVALQVKK